MHKRHKWVLFLDHVKWILSVKLKDDKILCYEEWTVIFKCIVFRKVCPWRMTFSKKVIINFYMIGLEYQLKISLDTLDFYDRCWLSTMTKRFFIKFVVNIFPLVHEYLLNLVHWIRGNVKLQKKVKYIRRFFCNCKSLA